MAGVAYTDEEAAKLTSEQFAEYMAGGDPLGKNKKKAPPPAPPPPPEGILRKRTRQANEAAGD